MLVPELLLLELALVILFEDALEDVLETTVIALKDSVLGAQIEGVVAIYGVFKATVSKFDDRVINVVHSHEDAGCLEIEDIEFPNFSSISGCENDFKLSSTIDHSISSAVLIPEGMASNHNRLSPSWHKSGYVFDDDRFPEHSASKFIADGSVG